MGLSRKPSQRELAVTVAVAAAVASASFALVSACGQVTQNGNVAPDASAADVASGGDSGGDASYDSSTADADAPDCAPTYTECVSGGLATCTPGGVAVTPCGARQACFTASGTSACKGWLCTPDTLECVGNTAIECSHDGFSTLSETDCSLSGTTCVQGNCLYCRPGELTCSGGFVEKCDASGTLRTFVLACSASQYCDPAGATCRPRVCAANAPACDGTLATTCNGDGSGYAAAGTDCAATGQLCIAGACSSKCAVRDVIVAVDQSGSMTTEYPDVIAGVKSMAAALMASNVDYRYVLLAASPPYSNGFCLDPPFAASTCPGDANPPAYVHVDTVVASDTPLEQIVNNYAAFSSYLRAGADLHVVIVSDDDSPVSAQAFDATLKQLDPARFAAYTVDAVFGPTLPPVFCFIGDAAADPCCQKTAAVGVVYQQLAVSTSGAVGNLCTGDFAPVATAITTCP